MKFNSVISTLFVVFMASVLFFSCENRRAAGRSGEIVFDSIVVKEHIPMLEVNDTTLPYADVSVSFTYPVKFKDSESLSRLQQIFKGTFFSDTEYDSMSPQDAVDLYLSRYTERYKEFSNMYYEDKARLGEGNMPMWYWYYMSVNNKILFQNQSILSYAVENSIYEGGAHGSFGVVNTNVDLNELVTITEEDLFIPGYYNPLTEKIVNNLMKDYDVEVADSLLMRGFFTIEDIVPNNNFWLNEIGINYSYNQYEIAPYFMGVIEVSIPYSELKDIIIPDGIISKNFLSESESE